MIIVSGVVADEVVELLCARLLRLGYDFVLLDQLRFPAKIPVTWWMEGDRPSGSLRIGTERVDLDRITGVYVRYSDYRGRDVLRRFRQREREIIKAEATLALGEMFDLMPCVVVNRIGACASNESKPYQSRWCARYFRVPRSRITTEPDEVLAFYEACGRRVVYKSMSGTRSIVRRLKPQAFRRLRFLRNCPVLFQEYVPGSDVRVHVVGEEVFAARVRSEATDYRYAPRSGASLVIEACSIPEDVAERCRRLTSDLGLAMSGIDLRETPEGAYYCFEVNPSPGFSYYERATGQPISEALANLLHAAPPQLALSEARRSRSMIARPSPSSGTGSA